MGTYADYLKALAAQGAPPPGQSGDDYAAAKAEAQAGIKKGEQSIPAPLLPLAQQMMAKGTGAFGDMAGRATGGIAALRNIIANAKARESGQPTKDTGAVYRGYRDAANAYNAGVRDDNPVSSAEGMAAGIEAGGAALKGAGGLLSDLKPVAQVLDAAKASAPVQALTKTGRAIKLAAQLKYTPAAVDYATETAKAGLSGGAGLGLLDLAQGKNPGDTLADTAAGTVGGVALRGLALPALDMASKGAVDFGRYIGSKFTNPPVGVTAAEKAAATRTAAELAARKGLTSANVMDKTAPYTDPLFGQMLGVEGQNLTGALSRRGGDTGDTLRAIQFNRAKARPAEIEQAAKQYMGFSPDEANDIINARVKHGQQTVAPMYAEAEESPFGVTSPALEALLQTATGKSTLANVTELAKLKGWNPEGLTYGRVEVPAAGEGANPMDAPPVGSARIGPNDQPPDLGPAPQVKVPRGPDEPPPRGMSLLNWIRKQGTLQDTGGELASQNVKGVGARSKNAMTPTTLHGLAPSAVEAGYFPEGKVAGPETTDNYHQITGADLHQAVLDEISGAKVRYGRSPDWKSQQAYDARQAAMAQNRVLANDHWNKQQDAISQFHADRAEQARQDEISATAGRELNPDELRATEAPPEGYTGGPAPQYEPAQQTALTPRSLIHLHQLSKPDYVNGQLAPGIENQRQAAFHQTLGKLLTGDQENGVSALLPKYEAPKDIAQEYLGLKGTYNDFKGSFFGGKLADFHAKVAGIKDRAGQFIPEKLQGAQLAAVNDVHELWAAGQLRGGKFLVPGVQERLEELFGPENAQAMVSKMEKTAEQAAAESRMAPFTNSSSAAMLNAGDETDVHAMAASDVAKVGKVASKGLVGGLGELAQKAGTWRRTAGSTVGYRNALGAIMAMQPAEQLAFLAELEKAGPVTRPPRVGAKLSGRLAAPLAQRKSSSSQLGAMAPNE